MRVHTKKHHTNEDIRFIEDIDDQKPIPADDVIKEICGERPIWAVALRGLRVREGLTQKQFGEKLGIEQTNISQMERGKRPIGKTIAKRLAKIFKTDYRLFL